MSQEKRMRGIVTAYNNSDLGAKEFATIKGITLYQLKYWVKKLNKQKAISSSFIPIKPTPTIPKDDLVEIEIAYPNGVKIKVPTANFSFLSQLIRVY